ncbi:hypothetical protein QUF80_14840 [Desulfococcaceae bacterium HSG8]|nr:hypothetical protein [Desulfococcaceae bacterium HSG8]
MIIKKMVLICILLFVFCGVAPAAEEMTVTHRTSPYIPGKSLEVAINIEYTGKLLAAGVEVTLPDGWTYVSHGGADKPLKHRSDMQFFWVNIPASPINFTYVVKVPKGAAGTQKISARAFYPPPLDGKRTKMFKIAAQPDPLIIKPNGSAAK